MSCWRMVCSCWYCAGLRIFCNCGALSAWIAWSCFIFCIGGSEGLFLIASILGPSALRIGSIWIFCCGVSLSCCDNACIFAAGSVVWPGAAGARVRNAKRQAADVRSVKGFLMAALYIATRDSPIFLVDFLIA